MNQSQISTDAADEVERLIAEAVRLDGKRRKAVALGLRGAVVAVGVVGIVALGSWLIPQALPESAQMVQTVTIGVLIFAGSLAVAALALMVRSRVLLWKIESLDGAARAIDPTVRFVDSIPDQIGRGVRDLLR